MDIVIQEAYQFIAELTKLKLVLRNTFAAPERKESTAEHSWSASMIVMILMKQLKKEFGEIDELKTLKLTLIHDLVEIYAGDVIAFDLEARKNKTVLEIEALRKLVSLNKDFGSELQSLWFEFEDGVTLEAKIAKAADSICPIFQRLSVKQSYLPFNINIATLEKVKSPYFMFSMTFTQLYQQLKQDLLKEKLIEE